MDEGFATYFGGAQRYYCLESSTQMALYGFQTLEVCFENKDELGVLIEEIVNFKNVFFGNFIKYLIDFHGSEYALHALKTNKTNDELDLLIDLHMLPDETFNDFVF
ncbi:hypothetical protein ACFSKL_08900 [Belliella marina]|uniref:Uncharacterized protein n=1 Tax=Belliella marina TaxID=1644146 RepID=A0ABW4VMF7_9BACT